MDIINHTFPGVVGVATKNIGPISSVVLMFIGFRQTSQIYLQKDVGIHCFFFCFMIL